MLWFWRAFGRSSARNSGSTPRSSRSFRALRRLWAVCTGQQIFWPTRRSAHRAGVCLALLRSPCEHHPLQRYLAALCDGHHHLRCEPNLSAGGPTVVMVHRGQCRDGRRLLSHAVHRPVPSLSDPDALDDEAHSVRRSHHVSRDRCDDCRAHGLAASTLRWRPPQRSRDCTASLLVQLMARCPG